MTETHGIPDDVRRFLGEHIHSVEQLEVLIWLLEHPAECWTGKAVARELRIDANSAASRLEDLVSRGLAAAGREPESFVYEPAHPERDRLVRSLARLYAERRVSIINLIFSKPVDRVRLFADAFRIRDEKEKK
jgi:hypothetical protein